MSIQVSQVKGDIVELIFNPARRISALGKRCAFKNATAVRG
jgi:hypothetical protein